MGSQAPKPLQTAITIMKNPTIYRVRALLCFVLALILVVLPSFASAAVSALGTPSKVIGANSIANYSVPAGNDRVLIVTVSNAEGVSYTTVNFGAQPMIKAIEKIDGVAVDGIWYCVLGNSGTSTVATVTATVAPGGAYPTTFLTAEAFAGVHQTTPTSSPVFANLPNTGTSSSVTVTSAAGDLVLDLVDNFKNASASPNNPGGGQTVINTTGSLPITAALASYTGFCDYSVSTKAGAPSVVMGWSGDYDAFIQVGINLRQSVAVAPTVTAINPTSGTTAGGTSVTITGTSFTGATGVTIGGTAATGVTVNSATSITATTPAHAAGAVSVVVTTPAGSNGANTLYTYVTPAPTVTAINPTSGTTAGGTSVTIAGTNFTGATGVTIGGTAATGVTVVNATSITATTPAHAAGAVSVVVTTPAGSNGANTLYTYVTPAPTVTAINPTSGTTAGGTSVTITGTNFTGATGVTIGGTAATGVTVVNATSITATTPAHAAGAVSVVVTTPAGSNGANTLYTYVTPAPTVTAINPTSGTTAGGTSVTITGTDFTGATGVTIGGTAATGVTVVNATTITATTPAHAAGAVSVVVTTPAGSNGANTLYTYVTPAPTVTAINPTSGTTAGGTSVTITGTTFTGATGVTIGGTAATGVTVVNATTITATTPAHAAGAVSVVVTTPAGSNGANTLYTYVTPAPTVTAINPTSGTTAGGTSVTITGTTFTGATGVTIGGTAATA